MATLKDLCSDGHTVCVSIHQPRSSVFDLIDDLVLLSGAVGGGGRGAGARGRVMQGWGGGCAGCEAVRLWGGGRWAVDGGR